MSKVVLWNIMHSHTKLWCITQTLESYAQLHFNLNYTFQKLKQGIFLYINEYKYISGLGIRTIIYKIFSGFDPEFSDGVDQFPRVQFFDARENYF